MLLEVLKCASDRSGIGIRGANRLPETSGCDCLLYIVMTELALDHSRVVVTRRPSKGVAAERSGIATKLDRTAASTSFLHCQWRCGRRRQNVQREVTEG